MRGSSNRTCHTFQVDSGPRGREAMMNVVEQGAAIWGAWLAADHAASVKALAEAEERGVGGGVAVAAGGGAGRETAAVGVPASDQGGHGGGKGQAVSSVDGAKVRGVELEEWATCLCPGWPSTVWLVLGTITVLFPRHLLLLKQLQQRQQLQQQQPATAIAHSTELMCRWTDGMASLSQACWLCPFPGPPPPHT